MSYMHKNSHQVLCKATISGSIRWSSSELGNAIELYVKLQIYSKDLKLQFNFIVLNK